MNRLALRYILCPIDFSVASAEALATGGAIARARNAGLRTRARYSRGKPRQQTPKVLAHSNIRHS